MENILAGQPPVLNAMLASQAALIHVEFLQQGGEKPHVVIHINSDRVIPALNTHGEPIGLKGCFFDMSYTGPGLQGTFLMHLVHYSGSSNSARAAFQFPYPVGGG